jgi:hypothetical protein
VCNPGVSDFVICKRRKSLVAAQPPCYARRSETNQHRSREHRPRATVTARNCADRIKVRRDRGGNATRYGGQHYSRSVRICSSARGVSRWPQRLVQRSVLLTAVRNVGADHEYLEQIKFIRATTAAGRSGYASGQVAARAPAFDGAFGAPLARSEPVRRLRRFRK